MTQYRQQADLILHNGKVLTIDEEFSVHQAVVVRDGLVVAVGGSDLVATYDATEVIDLRGRLLMPGFNDTHIHIRGHAARHVPLVRVKSIEEIKTLVAEKLSELGVGEWITGFG